jgi:peroxiredoxin Q/BCP
MALQIGDNCPSFKLANQFGEFIDSSNLIGTKNLVIYFYPKDDTPGCTKEACSFRDSYEEFKDLGCEVLGISSDSVEDHKKFAEKYRLSFNLLADTSKELRKAIGVPGNLFGLIPGRVTYIIDLKGKIRGVYNSQTNPLGHIEQALELVKKL